MIKVWLLVLAGAQAGGCRFDKKPQYRYSGCHERDASALSILLGQRSGFEESQYAAQDADRHAWRRVTDDAARAELDLLLKNATEHDPTAPAPLPPHPRTERDPDALTPRPTPAH